MAENPNLVRGSIWRERDTRFDRKVVVWQIGSDWIRIKTLGSARTTKVRADRFLRAFVFVSLGEEASRG